jgi:hypothetical protein
MERHLLWLLQRRRKTAFLPVSTRFSEISFLFFSESSENEASRRPRMLGPMVCQWGIPPWVHVVSMHREEIRPRRSSNPCKGHLFQFRFTAFSKLKLNAIAVILHHTGFRYGPQDFMTIGKPQIRFPSPMKS